jgi:hypothetical protein
MRHIRAVCCVSLLASALGVGEARPQTSLTLELIRPAFEQSDFKALLMMPRLQTRLSGATDLVVDLPLASARLGPGESEARYGNPWVGVRRGQGDTHLELGIRLPLAQDEAGNQNLPLLAGALGDFNRSEAWLPEVTTAQFRVTSVRRSAEGLVMAGHIGATAWFPRSGGDTEVFADYGAGLGLATPAVEVTGGIVGRMLLTQSGGSLDDRMVNQLELAVAGRRGGVRPFGGVRIPLDDDLSGVLRLAISVGLRIRLR